MISALSPLWTIDFELWWRYGNYWEAWRTMIGYKSIGQKSHWHLQFEFKGCCQLNLKMVCIANYLTLKVLCFIKNCHFSNFYKQVCSKKCKFVLLLVENVKIIWFFLKRKFCTIRRFFWTNAYENILVTCVQNLEGNKKIYIKRFQLSLK